jgi:hypothetical protein
VTDDQVKTWVESVIVSTNVSCEKANVRVTVQNKVVTLSGGVKTQKARKTITDAVTAQTICCVVRVVDNMADIGPQCPSGSVRCLTMDGEEWCCYGCRRGCPILQ